LFAKDALRCVEVPYVTPDALSYALRCTVVPFGAALQPV